MEFFNFLKQMDKSFFAKLNEKDKVYRGEIPWILQQSKAKKIIYISTSNKNLENYYSMLDNYYNEKNTFSKSSDKDTKYIDMFENISQTKEDIVGINVKMLDILRNQDIESFVGLVEPLMEEEKKRIIAFKKSSNLQI